jgi:drug/metabolite transporter (DMT)-like permease
MHNRSDQRLRGVLFAIGAALTWSAAGVGIKLLPLTPPSIAGYRALFALPVLLVAFLASCARDRVPAFSELRRALRQPLTFVGAVAYAACVTLFVFATKRTTAANAILFQYSAPIYVALLSGPLLGERVRLIDWLAVLGCLCGMAFCFADKVSATGLSGNLLALLSGLAFGLLPIIWRRQLLPKNAAQLSADDLKLRARLPSATLLLGNALIPLLALPFMVADAPRSVTVFVGVFLLGSVQIGVAYLLYAAAVSRLRAVESLLAATIEPILNPIWVALWAHELPGRATFLGGVIILCTVVLHGVLLQRRARDGQEGT